MGNWFLVSANIDKEKNRLHKVNQKINDLIYFND
jgi:hypothetical protein